MQLKPSFAVKAKTSAVMQFYVNILYNNKNDLCKHLRFTMFKQLAISAVHFEISGCFQKLRSWKAISKADFI